MAKYTTLAFYYLRRKTTTGTGSSEANTALTKIKKAVAYWRLQLTSHSSQPSKFTSYKNYFFFAARFMTCRMQALYFPSTILKSFKNLTSSGNKPLADFLEPPSLPPLKNNPRKHPRAPLSAEAYRYSVRFSSSRNAVPADN